MNTIAKPGALKEYHPLRDTLAQAADTIIAERRKAQGWQHYADDLIATHTANLKREFWVGLTVGALLGSVLAVAAVCAGLWL